MASQLLVTASENHSKHQLPVLPHVRSQDQHRESSGCCHLLAYKAQARKSMRQVRQVLEDCCPHVTALNAKTDQTQQVTCIDPTLAVETQHQPNPYHGRGSAVECR